MPSPHVIVSHIRVRPDRASATLRVGRFRSRVRFRGVAPDRHAADAFVSIGRAAALAHGSRVVSTAPITRGARDRHRSFEQANLAFYEQLRGTRLTAPPSLRPSANGMRTAAFSSGGVDSVHAVLENHSRIDDLVFVRGFDVSVDDARRTRSVLVPVRRLAAELGKPLLVVETDARSFLDRFTDWRWSSYAAMIAVSILLGGTHRRTLCAASVADVHLPPHLLDIRATGRDEALYAGNDAVQMELVGTSPTRVEKVRDIVEVGVGHDSLRVCWQNVPGRLNCGQCTKCLLTMAALDSMGALRDYAGFPRAIDLARLARVRIGGPADRAFLLESLAAAEAANRPDLRAALETSLVGARGAGARTPAANT